MDLPVITSTLAANIFNQNWPDGIVGLLEVFCLCCLLGGIAAFAICRSRHSYRASAKRNSKVTEVNSNRLANDRNKDAL